MATNEEGAVVAVDWGEEVDLVVQLVDEEWEGEVGIFFFFSICYCVSYYIYIAVVNVSLHILVRVGYGRSRRCYLSAVDDRKRHRDQ